MAITVEQFEARLIGLLRERPSGAAAELAECIVAYWDGSRIVYAFLCEHGSGRIEEEFDLAEYEWDEWEPEFALWLADPRFSDRAELAAKLHEHVATAKDRG